MRHNLFPTLVMEYENVLSDEQRLNIIDKLDYTKFTHQGAVMGGNSVSSFSVAKCIKEIIDDESSQLIFQKLESKIKDYQTITGYKTLQILNSWVNIQTPDSVLDIHTHPGSVISGSLYLNVDDDSSSLTFYNPNPFNTFIDFNSVTDYTAPSVIFHPKNGGMLLFPSWLQHGSGQQRNFTHKRIVLSFNTGYKLF